MDLGCGAGGNALALAERGWRVTCVDIAPRAIAGARASACRRGLDLELVVGDSAIRQPDGSYDLVLSSYALPPRGPVRTATLAVRARRGISRPRTRHGRRGAHMGPQAAWHPRRGQLTGRPSPPCQENPVPAKTAPTGRFQPPDVRRRQILDAVAALLLEEGYEALTISKVAVRAGVAKGTAGGEEPMGAARDVLVTILTEGAKAGEFDVTDAELTTDFLTHDYAGPCPHGSPDDATVAVRALFRRVVAARTP
ncbi:methyltransferase domain-containing protein [Streptomyces inhibens]|uniref:methyltransferase domain-containing protein n=1 Tax=Streptomyces inhibens TaxID=2293571 RepID=UPI00379F5A64